MKAEIRLLATDLEEGESCYLTCPSCGRAKKFSLTERDGVVLYNCFRPSCTLHGGGAVRVDGRRVVHTTQAPRKQGVTPYTGELVALDEEWLDYLQSAIGFNDEHIVIARPMYAPEDHRVAYPIFSPMGRRRGWSLRSYTGAEPKALTRPDREEPHLSWYMEHPEQLHVVVVEDIPSAVRVAKYTNSLAICGTGVGPDYAREIAAHTRNVVWALDADATQQAVRLQRKWGLMFDTSRVLVLPKDFKDMTEEEICEILSSLS